MKPWELKNIEYSDRKLSYTTGKPPIFKSPKEFWNASVEYFEAVYNNPLQELVFAGKDAEERIKPHTEPLSWIGFAAYHGVSEMYHLQLEKRLKESDDEVASEFVEVITRVRSIMRSQRFSGASCGFYKPVTASDCVLKDDTVDNETKDEGSFNIQLSVNTFVREKKEGEVNSSETDI